MTVGGQLGHFNFSAASIEDERTPGKRYAFDTESGRRFYYQLEKDYQGGRWEDAAHAAQDFEGYKRMAPGQRTRALGLEWPDQEIAETIDRAATAGKSLDELKDELSTFNTNRQISTPQPDALRRFPLPGAVTTPILDSEQQRLAYLEFQSKAGVQTKTPATEAEMEKLKEDIRARKGKIDIWETFGNIFTKKGLAEITPFVGGPVQAFDAIELLLASQRVEAGTATDPEYQTLVDFDTARKEEAFRGKTFWAGALEIASQIPAFGVEFITTGGVYYATKKLTLEGVQALVLNSAKKAVTRSLRRRAAAAVAGTAVHSVTHGILSTRYIAGTAQRMIPEFTVQGNDLLFLDEGDNFFPALIRTVGDHFIEIGSERTGGALAHLPGAAQLRHLREAVAARWLRLNPNKTLDDLLVLVRDQAGWHGPLGEIFEERVGEEARRFTGLGEGQPTVIGQFLTGEGKEAWRQLMMEAAAFAVPGAAAVTLRALSGDPVTPAPPGEPAPPPFEAPGEPPGPPGGPPPPAAPAPEVEVQTSVPEAQAQAEEQEKEQARQARTEELTEKWGALPDKVADKIGIDLPLNPKVEELVYAINSTGLETEMSGDLFSDRVLYVDIHREDVERIDEGALPEGWSLVTSSVDAVDEFLGGEMTQEQLERLDATRNLQDDNRLVRAGDEPVSSEDLDAIVAAMTPGKPAAKPIPEALIEKNLEGIRQADEYIGNLPAENAELIQYAKQYRDFRFGLGVADPGKTFALPAGLGGSSVDVRSNIDQIARDLGIEILEDPKGPPPDVPGMAPEEKARLTAIDEAKEVLSGLESKKEIDYAIDYRDFLFGQGQDPGTRLPIDQSGPIRMQLEEIGTRLGIPRPGAAPTEIPPTPDAAAEAELWTEADVDKEVWFGNLEGVLYALEDGGENAVVTFDDGTQVTIPTSELSRTAPTPTPKDKAKLRKTMAAFLDKQPDGTTFEITEEDVADLSLRPGHTFVGQWVKEELETDEYGRQISWRETTRNLQHNKSSAFWELGLGTVEKAIERSAAGPVQVGAGPKVVPATPAERRSRAVKLENYLDDLPMGATFHLDDIPVDIEGGERFLGSFEKKEDVDGSPIFVKSDSGEALTAFEFAQAQETSAGLIVLTDLQLPTDLLDALPEDADPDLEDFKRRVQERALEAEALKKELDALPVGTSFELEREDLPQRMPPEDMDDYIGVWEKIERKLTAPQGAKGPRITWQNLDNAFTRSSTQFAKVQRDLGGRFMLRPERPSPNIVEEPEDTPPGKGLDPYDEQEREEERAVNPGFFAPAETGQRFAAPMIQGRGATLEEIYGAQAVKAGVVSPVAGAAQYYSFTEDHAKRYGPEVSTHDIVINNPMVIDNDRQWTDLLDKADAYALYSVDQHEASPEERPEAARRFQNYLRTLGHDGIIVKVPQRGDSSPSGEKAKRLRETWGETQAVVFYENAPITVAELRDAVLAKTDISEEQVDAWIELLKSHAEGTGMTLQTWVDSRIAKVEGLPSLRRKDGTLPPGALDTLLYQRRAPLSDAQFMRIWNGVYPALKAERLKTVASGDLAEEDLQDLFIKAWNLRKKFFNEQQLKDWLGVSNAPLQRTYGDKVSIFRAPDIEALGASLLAKPQKGPRAFKGWKTLLIADLGPGVNLAGIDLAKLYRRSKIVYARTLRATVAGKLPSAKTLGRLYDKGEANKHWFDKFWQEIQVVFGEDAELFANLAAAHSQMTDTSQNAERSLQAYIELKTGVPFTTVGPARKLILANLNRAAQGKPLSGIKVTNFLKNLMGDLSAVTLDRHMMGIFFGDKRKAPTERQHQIVTKIVTKAAQQVGVEPAQYQAALWAAVRDASEERAAPLEQIMWRLLREDPRFAGLRDDLIKNAAAPDAVRTLLGVAADEVKSKRIPEPPETLPGVNEATVRAVSERMEATPSEEALNRALLRSNTFLDEGHVEDWFAAQGVTGPDRIKAQADAKAKALLRQKPAEAEDQFVFRVGEAKRRKPSLIGEENLLAAIRGPQEAEVLRKDPELRERRSAQEQSQEAQPTLPLARDMEDEYLTALASDMFFMDVNPAAEAIAGMTELAGRPLHEAIRSVLQQADEPLGTTEILSALKAGGYKFKKKPRHHLNTQLSRMKDLVSKSEGRDLKTGKMGRKVWLPLPKPDILFQRPNPLSEAEFMAVWEEQANYLRVVAREITQDDQAAQDVRQETFAKAWTRIDRFIDKTHAKNWLNMTARRGSLDWLKKNVRLPKRVQQMGATAFVPDAPVLPKVEKQIFFEEIRQLVQPVIDAMPQMNREALLSMFDEVSARQTATEMGINYNTLLSRRRIAFNKIKDALADVDLERNDLFQRGESKNAKGAVQFLQEGRAILYVLEATDIATLIHESTHIFRRDLNAADTATLEDWQGIKNGRWTVQNEENVARAMERYLQEGVVPEGEPKLKILFEKFKTWLRGIYETITGSAIDIQIPDSVRPVLARMLGITEAAEPEAEVESIQVKPEDLKPGDRYHSSTYGQMVQVESIPKGNPDGTVRIKHDMGQEDTARSTVLLNVTRPKPAEPYVWPPELAIGDTVYSGKGGPFPDGLRKATFLGWVPDSRKTRAKIQYEDTDKIVTVPDLDIVRSARGGGPLPGTPGAALPPTPAEVEAGVEVTDLRSAFRTVATVLLRRPEPEGKAPFVAAVQHRRVLEDVPANQTLRVMDGLAYSSNGSISLITRSDLKDGLYSPYVEGQPKSFKKLKEDEDLWFPEVAASEEDGRFTFRAAGDLRRAWRNIRTAEPSRMVLGSLQLEIEGSEDPREGVQYATLRSTDGRRATLNTVPFLSGSAKPGTYLIPRKAIELILKDKKAEEIEVLIGGGSITMITDHLAVSSLPVKGEYPKFERLMPDPERELHVDRKVLLKSLKTLKAEMDPKEPGVYFWMHDEGTLEMGVLKEKIEGKPDTFTTKMVFKETSPSLTASPTNITILMPRRKDLKDNSDFALDIFYLTDIVEGVAGDDVLFGVPKKADGIFGFAGSLTPPWRTRVDKPKPVDEPLEELPPTPEEEARSPHMNLAYALLRELNAGENINNRRLTTLANEAFGGTRGEGKYNPRDSYDAMEVGLNLYIEDQELIDFDNPEATVKRLRALHAKMPAQIDRTEEGIEFQQFSSPPDLAFAAVYAAAIPSGYPLGEPGAQLVALEPSAGTGSIAIMLDEAGAAVIVNEKAPRRAQLLKDQEFETFEVDAEFLHTELPANIQPDIIVMNPPFSATGGRTKTHATKYGAKHITEALARLNKGGRLVAIVGQGMAMDTPAFRDWWERKVMFKYTVRANIGIAGKHYRKWGTSFGQQLIVIDKTGRHDLINAPLADKLKKVIMGKDLSPQEALRLLRPLAEEDISGRLYRLQPERVSQRPTEAGVPPTPTEVRRGREEAPGPVAPPGDVLPEGGPEGGYQPPAGPPGRTDPEELGRLEPGEGQLPEEVQPGGREDPGVGEPGGPVEPGRTPGVGGVPGPGDIRPTEPVTGLEEGFGTRNTVFTKEEADKAREDIRKRIRDLGTELEMGMPPDLLRSYFKLGGYYFEGGLREFGPWSRKMLEDLGEGARPVLQSVYDTVKGFYEAKEQEDAAKFTKERRQSVIEEEDPFSPYSVTKHIFAGSQPHPANIVESSYLATVPTPEPPVEGDEGYMKLPEEVITEGRLSDLQAEAVQIMLQRWATLFPDGKRPGFWLGDGTGLGKGREIGAAMWDNHISGRKRAVWFSTNHQLIADAQRDLSDLGAPMKLLAHQDVKTKGTIPDRDGVLFTAYSYPSYHIRTDAPRFHQLTDWLGPDFDGVIAFDESHLLKNAVMGGRSGTGAEEGTQRGRMAAMLEEMYPKARFVYVSATAATVPRNMGYMSRLGLWGPGLPFATFIDFLGAMARGGMGAMEMLSRDLKAIGAFIARTISFDGVEYEVVKHELTPMEVDQYNNIADVWKDLLNAFEDAIDTANQPKANQFTPFYNAQQRFFLLVMASLKLPTLYTETAKDLAEGRSVIINLFNTNEGSVTRMVNQARADGIDLAELDFTPKQIIVELIERHFPIHEYVDKWDPTSQQNVKIIREDDDGNPIPNKENMEKQAELLDRLADISFPDNPLDAIVNHFGHQNVAEISGRDRRFEGTKHVRRKIEGVRHEKLDQKEIERFQEGEVRVAIITGSAATGISLHSDLSRKNQQRRSFYAFQLSWSADTQLQSLGRAHRSSQAQPPIYRLLRTNLSAEERLVNATSRRLASLGALSAGSREALGGNLFSIEDLTDVYGEAAVQVTYADIREGDIEGIAGGVSLLEQMGMADADGNIKQRNNADTNVNRFLNRIMALHVDVQNIVFNHFYSHYQRIVQQAQKDGVYDMGIQPIRDSNWNKALSVTLKGEKEVIYTHPNSGAETQLIELTAEFPVRTISFQDSKRLGRGIYHVNKKSGKIYTAYDTGRTRVVGGLQSVDPKLKAEQPLWTLTNPKGLRHDVPGYQLDPRFNFEKLDELIPAEAAEAERMWNAELALIPATKAETIDILTGAVMPIYDKVVGLGDKQMTNLRIVRAVLEDGTSYIGIRIKPKDLGPLRQRLGIGTPLGEATPGMIYNMVLEQGSIVELDNGWQLRRTKVHGEPRMELDPRGKYNRDEMKGYEGVYEETLDYSRRFFIPIDHSEGPKAVASILNLHKAVRDIFAESDLEDLEGPGTAGMPDAGMPGMPGMPAAGMPSARAGELGAEPFPYVTGTKIPPTPGADTGAARTRLWAEGIPEGAIVYRPKKPEYMPGMPFGSRRIQREWVDPVTGVVWPAQSVPWVKVRVGHPGGVFPEQIPVDDPLRQQAPDPIMAMEMDYEMVMPLVNQWEGDDPSTIVDKPEVINAFIKIVEAAGKTIVIYTGRIAERAEGIFKIMIEVIRLAKALHIPAASHEIAHALEKAIYGWKKGGPWIFRTHSQRKDLVRLGQELYGVPGTQGAATPNYGYMREGWAEFFRIYLTGEDGEAQRRAPHLHKWFVEEFLTEHKEVSDAIEHARLVVKKYRLQGNDARIMAQMPVKAPHTSMVVSMVKAINYMNWVESLAPIERLENMAMKIRGPDNPLPIVKRPFLVASSLRNLGPVTVHGWMLRSMTDIAGNAVGRPLKDIVNLIKATGIPHVQAKFMWFMYSLRAKERWNRKTRRNPEGMNPGITLADAEAYIETWQNDKFWLAADWFQEWNLGVLNYAMQGGLITERTLNRIMQGSTDYAGLARIFDDVSPDFFQNFDRLTRGGSRNPFPYFYGAGERVKNIWTTAIERATRIAGQTHQRIVIDLMVKLEYAAHGMGQGIEEVPRDKTTFNLTILRALEALAKEAVTAEQEELIEELREKFGEEDISDSAEGRQRTMLEQVLNFYVPAYQPKGADPIVPIFDVQGQTMKWYRVDGQLYESLTMMDPYRLEGAVEFFFGNTTRIFRMTTTALRPTFAWWRNLVKDPQTWAMQTQTNANALKMAQTWIVMLGDITFRGRKSPWFQQALRLGIEVSTPVGQDIRQIERAVKKLFHGKVPEVMLSPVDVARDWLSVPEYTTRAAEMKLIAQDFDKDPDNPGMGMWYPGDRPLTFEESTRMRLGIKRATVDFSSSGRVGRKANQVMPFFNPQIQGMRQFLRVLTPEERARVEGELYEVHLLTGKPYTKIAKGRIRRSFLWGTSVFVLPTLALWWGIPGIWAGNKDEEWYKAMPWWEKFTYWNIGTATKIWQIPRAHEYGPFFSAMTEAIFDAAYREDPEAMKQVMNQLLRQGNPFSFPPPAQFAIEEIWNVDLWTGSPIIPEREKVYPPGMQRGRYTSKLAIMIGEQWPRTWWTSPRRVDHAIRSFFGGLGPDLLQMLGLGVGPGVVSRIGYSFAPHDTEQEEPLPTIGYLAFAQRAGGKYGIRDRYVDEFYEEYAKVDRDYRWRRAMELPIAESGQNLDVLLRGETIQELHWRNLLLDARYAMSLLNRMARDPSITQEQLDHVKITQRQIAYDVMQLKRDQQIDPSPLQEEAIRAGQRDLTLDEQYRLLERLYIESQVIDNDPGSFWAKVQGMGLDPRRVLNMLNSTRLEIALLQISKSMIHSPSEIENIDGRIIELQQRQAFERFEGVSRGARFGPRSISPPGVIPGIIPEPPSVDILNPGRDPRAP